MNAGRNSDDYVFGVSDQDEDARFVVDVVMEAFFVIEQANISKPSTSTTCGCNDGYLWNSDLKQCMIDCSTFSDN